MVDGIAHPRLSRQVDNNVWVVLFEHAIHQRLVHQVALDKGAFDRTVCRGFFDLCQAVFLQAQIIVVVHVVKAYDVSGRKLPQKTYNKIRTDKAGRAGDEDHPA